MWFSKADSRTVSLVSTYDILIPIFNALSDLRACLESVLAFTNPRHRIFLLDDASTDPAVKVFLEEARCLRDSIQVHSLSENVGFLKNVNAGMRRCENNDVILLNSDTVVSEGWLEGLVRAQHSSPNIGIVSPLFTEGSFLSFPSLKGGNDLRDGRPFAERARRLRDTSPCLHPEIPAGIGSCILITQAVIKSIGYFDPAFSPGYWEEIDYSLRAKAAGFKVVCADDVYIFHRGASSFSSVAREALTIRNRKIIDVFWPEIFNELRSFIQSDPFSEHASRFLATPS